MAIKHRIAEENKEAEKLIPPSEPDGSKIGINYTGEYIKSFDVTLEDGTKVNCKRRGLKLTLTIGDKKGEALLRRLDHGPEVKDILRHALEDAAEDAGARFLVEDGVIYLEVDN